MAACIDGASNGFNSLKDIGLLTCFGKTRSVQYHMDTGLPILYTDPMLSLPVFGPMLAKPIQFTTPHTLNAWKVQSQKYGHPEQMDLPWSLTSRSIHSVLPWSHMRGMSVWQSTPQKSCLGHNCHLILQYEAGWWHQCRPVGGWTPM